MKCTNRRRRISGLPGQYNLNKQNKPKRYLFIHKSHKQQKQSIIEQNTKLFSVYLESKLDNGVYAKVCLFYTLYNFYIQNLVLPISTRFLHREELLRAFFFKVNNVLAFFAGGGRSFLYFLDLIRKLLWTKRVKSKSYAEKNKQLWVLYRPDFATPFRTLEVLESDNLGMMNLFIYLVSQQKIHNIQYIINFNICVNLVNLFSVTEKRHCYISDF